ncbi:MAG: DUF6069 family protein [Actinomycetota bacterium]
MTQQRNRSTPRGNAGLRLGGLVGAATAVVAVWVIARYAADVQLHAPAFGDTQQPSAVPLGLAIAVAVLAGLASWGLAGLLARRTARPRRTWLATSLTVLVLSLSGPLSGHGVAAGDRVALVGLHLVVAAVLVPIFALSLSPRAGDRSRPLNSEATVTTGAGTP